MRTFLKVYKPLVASFSSGGETRFEKCKLVSISVRHFMIFLLSALNEVRLLGRSGGDAKKGGTETHPVVYFSLATHNSYKSGDSGKC